MDFSYDYWLSELQVFHGKFADPASTEEVLGLLVRGLCHLAANTVTEHPEKKDQIMEDFGACMSLARERMGLDWFVQHAAVIATHGRTLPT